MNNAVNSSANYRGSVDINAMLYITPSISNPSMDFDLRFTIRNYVTNCDLIIVIL